MHHNIIKDTINLDKKAREEVAKLIKKKEHLDELVGEESKKLHQSFVDEIKEKIRLTEEKYELEMTEKKKSELLTYKETLKKINLISGVQVDKNTSYKVYQNMSTYNFNAGAYLVNIRIDNKLYDQVKVLHVK